MSRERWWRPDESRAARAVAVFLALLLAGETAGCAGGGRLVPRRTNVALISPWRYYDLWEALRVGRGVLIGMTGGQTVAGKFVSGGAKSIRIRGDGDDKDIATKDIRYLVNVIDLSRSREGAVAGGLIGLGMGLSIAWMSGGQSSSAASRPARNAEDDTEPSSSDDSQSSTTSDDSQSSSDEGASSATDPAESGSNTYDDSGGSSSGDSESSSEGSSTSDPAATGSNTYDEGGSSSDGGSSTGGTGASDQSSSESSGNSTVFVSANGEEQSSGGSSTGGQNGQPSGGSGTPPGIRAFYLALTFAAVGSFVGWLVGRRMRQQVPRVDYVLFPENLDDQGDRSPAQYLADQITEEAEQKIIEFLPPDSRFDSPRSAAQFDRYAAEGHLVRLCESVEPVISREMARAYGLFTAVEGFEQASIVRCDDVRELSGTETRYLAVVTRRSGGVPTVSLQRLSTGDVIRLATQVNLIRAGIILP